MKNSANKNNGNALPSKSRANPLFTPHPKVWQIHYAMPPGKRQGGFGMDLNSRLLELEEIASRDIDILVTFGAGDIDRLVQPIENLLKEKYA